MDFEQVEIFTEDQVSVLKTKLVEWQKGLEDKKLIIVERKYRLFVDSRGKTMYSIAVFYLIEEK